MKPKFPCIRSHMWYNMANITLDCMLYQIFRLTALFTERIFWLHITSFLTFHTIYTIAACNTFFHNGHPFCLWTHLMVPEIGSNFPLPPSQSLISCIQWVLKRHLFKKMLMRDSHHLVTNLAQIIRNHPNLDSLAFVLSLFPHIEKLFHSSWY